MSSASRLTIANEVTRAILLTLEEDDDPFCDRHDHFARRSGRHRMMEFVDIYPTLCELAGLPLPNHLEGTSFAPLLDQPDRPWKNAAFSQYPHPPFTGRSIRTDRYRFTRWAPTAKPSEVAGLELYDHQSDPGENVNIAARPENAQLVERLSAQLDAGWQAVEIRPSIRAMEVEP